jgi:hypothetical protein
VVFLNIHGHPIVMTAWIQKKKPSERDSMQGAPIFPLVGRLT